MNFSSIVPKERMPRLAAYKISAAFVSIPTPESPRWTYLDDGARFLASLHTPLNLEWSMLL